MKIYCSALLVFAACLATAQNHDLKPSDALKKIDFITGDWKGDRTFNNPAGGTIPAKDENHIHLAVSGHFIEESSITRLEGRPPADVRHLIGFDPKTGKYKAWWFNDTSPVPTELDGDLDGDNLVFMTHPSTPGWPVMKATFTRLSDRKMAYKLEMQQGDNWTELFHIDYKKAK